MKRRKLKKTVIAKFIILVSFIGLGYSGYHIIKWNLYVKDNASIKTQIDNNIDIIINDETQETEYKIDFTDIKERNGDAIAYLKVNGTDINYIVVRGLDNKYYLTHNFDKKYNKGGWIFADYHNKFDETDKNIVIYGHNVKDGSMFNTLKSVLNREWYDNPDNYKILLRTEQDTYYYEVFSTYTITAEDYYINTIFPSDDEYKTFINTVKSRSIHDYGVPVDESDKILTLSSCLGNGVKRVVLHAKLISKDKLE